MKWYVDDEPGMVQNGIQARLGVEMYLHGVGKGEQEWLPREMGDTKGEIFQDKNRHLSENKWYAKRNDNGV